MKFSIKGENILVEVSVLGRPYTSVENVFDLNWLACGVRIRIPAYTADFSTCITCEELSAFYVELRNMNESLQGKAVLSPLDSEICISTEMNKLGKLLWNVKTQHPAGYGATLCFEFESDQSYLDELLKDLEHIVEKYPTIKLKL